ncbi:MAG: amidase [Candidatus Dormibacteria bacterium]
MPRAAPPPPASEPLSWLGAVELAVLMRRRELAPTELLRECLSRIDELDPRLNAFVALARDASAAAAASEVRILGGAPRLLEGLPVAVKDNRAVAGLAVTQGSLATVDRPAARDDEVVRRLRAAGAVVVGKTTLPEFGAIPVTESRRLGITRNPWDLDRTPGGSSGGSAAAVAAGLVPLAEGNDGAGSLRIPGSCCGLFALKPTRGRIPLDESAGEDGAGLAVEGFLTRTVADTALLLDAVSGPAPWESQPLPAPVEPYSSGAARRPRCLRVGWTTQPPLQVPVDPACQAAVGAAAELLEGLGHQVEELAPAESYPAAAADFRRLWGVAMQVSLQTAATEGGEPQRAEPHVLALAELGAQVSAAEYAGVRRRLQLSCARVARQWAGYDLVITPTLAQPPLKVGELLQDGAERPLAVLDRSDHFSPFTPLANLSGQPAAQVPLQLHQGLPIGVQLSGRWGDEMTLLQVAQQLEDATAWPERRPPLGGPWEAPG